MKTTGELDAYIKLLMQFTKMTEVFEKLSKSTPNDHINDLKLECINVMLEQANALIVKNNKPIIGIVAFDPEKKPTNSDVYLILSQYLACMKKYGLEQTRNYNSKCYWVLNERRTILEADINLLK
jgi:hypothetical protein